MKKVMVGVVIVVAAVAAYTMLTNKATTAEEKEKTKITVETKKSEPGETITVREKDKGVGDSTIQTTTLTEKPGDMKVDQKTEFEKGVPTQEGFIKECDATFQKVDEKNMHAYFMKDNEMYRLKYPDNMKENVMKYNKGDKVHVWSTYELNPAQLKKYSEQDNVLHKCEKLQ